MSQTEGATVYLTYEQWKRVHEALRGRNDPHVVAAREAVYEAIQHLDFNREGKHVLGGAA